MSPTMNAYLAAAITASQPDDNSVRTGTVFSIDGTTLGVEINGGVVPCGYLSNWVPAVGQTVAMMRQGADWLVLGPMGGPAAVQANVPVAFAATAYSAGTGFITSPDFQFAGDAARRYTRQAANSRLLVGVWMTGLFNGGGSQAEVGIRVATRPGGSIVAQPFLGIIHGPIASYRLLGGGMSMIEPFPAGDYDVIPVVRRSLGANSFFRNGDDITSIFFMEIPT